MAAAAVRLIDTIGQDLGRLRGLSYWHDRPVLSYTTRSYAATAAQRAWFPHFWGIDQAPTNGLLDSRIKDAEPGAALNSNVVALARAGAKFTAYTFRANYGALRQAVDATGRGANVTWFLADWTASESRALATLNSDPRIVAVQWCSPSYGGGIVVPGTSSTVRELNVDLSIGRLDFWMPQAPPPPAHPAQGVWKGAWALDAHNGQWDTQPQPGHGVVRSTADETDYAVVGVDLHTGQQRIRGLDRATGKRLLGF